MPTHSKPAHSSMHAQVNWAKERLDEMDAALASLESRSGKLHAESKAKADHLVADLTKRRDEFAAAVKKQSDAGEAAWERSRAQLDSQWNTFEKQVKAYMEGVGKQMEQQQATFHDLAAAQVKAWHDAADRFQKEMTGMAADRRAEIDAAVKRMKSDASEAEARLHKLKDAGYHSWGAMTNALAESRKAFDRANQTTADAFKHAISPKSTHGTSGHARSR
jgi:DNA anti-recombination protein RmuC